MSNPAEDKSQKRLKSAIIGFCIIFVLLYAGAFAYSRGYRHGQIDAAQGVREYLVIDGQVVHIEGPAPERAMSPKDIEGGSK